MLDSITFWLILLGALSALALGWLLVRTALVVGGQAAAAATAAGMDHAYEGWASFGPLRLRAERGWDGAQRRLGVWLFGWHVVDRQLEDEEDAGKEEKALARWPRRLHDHLEVDWLELASWVLERRYLVALDPVHGFLRFGFDDPARTGEISGLLCALSGMLPRGIVVTHQPVFGSPVLEAEGRGTIRIYPLPILSWLAWFALSRVRFHARPRHRLPAAEEK